MRLPFTAADLQRIKTPTKRTWYRDTRLPGLSLMVTPNGVKTFYVDLKRHRKRWQIRLGRFPDLTLEEARRRTVDEIARADANVERDAKDAATFRDLFLDWYAIRAAPTKRTADQDMRRFNRDLKSIHDVPLGDLTTQHLDDIISRVIRAGQGRKADGTVNANRTIALLKAVLTWGVKRGRLEKSPAAPLEKFPERSRDRTLNRDELSRFFDAIAAEADPWPDFFRLLIFTGARRGNVASMRWEDIDLDQALWTIPADDAKGKRPIRVPLIRPAVDLLLRRKQEASAPWPFVFPSGTTTGHVADPRKAWQRIQKRARLEDVVMHDLRRTLGTLMANDGAALSVIAALLGHADERVTRTYAKYDVEPVRAALERVAPQLLEGPNDHT